jgi:beta-mannosidase
MTRKILLNGLWDYEAQARVLLKPNSIFVEDPTNLPPAGQMELPANWELGGLHNFNGRVQFRRRFTFDGLRPDEQEIRLCFRGVDYFARVWLNGHELGTHEGYFQTFDFDVTEAVKPGENELVVGVTCPMEEPGTVWPHDKIVIKGILSHWDARPGSWDRHTGQDMPSGGIWNDVYLETFAAARINHVRFATKILPREVPNQLAFTTRENVDVSILPRQAIVLADVEISGPEGYYTLKIEIGNSPIVTQEVWHQPQSGPHTIVVEIAEPRLWWVWDLGEPTLETSIVTLARADKTLHEKKYEIGLREIRFDPERGEWWLNGVRFFVRGTNVVPTLWLGEYDAAMIARDIDLLKAAHVNGVRVCVHVNREEFYTACDRAGLLVWQDFALQWGYAPTQSLYQESIRQIRDMVRMLVNHPSIAIWVCQNESTFHNKFVLDPVLAAAIATEDSTRCIRPTSEFTEHTYGGWYGSHYLDYLTTPATPVNSEFGAQALPDAKSMRAMIGDEWPPDWDKMAYHDFQYDQTFHVAGISLGNNWEEFVENSQTYQAKLLKFALEQYRQHKYEALGGFFQFMFMDCWPSITWSVVSYERVPKKGYFVLQECLQPVLIGANLYRNRIFLGKDRGSHARPLEIVPWVVNDRHEPLDNCIYLVQVEGPGGSYEFTSPAAFNVPGDGVQKQVPRLVCDLPANLKPGPYTLRLLLKQGERILSQNHYNVQIESVPGVQSRNGIHE